MWVPSLGGKIPWIRKWQPSPVFLPGKSHGQRSMEGYSPWGRNESDKTECVRTHTHTHNFVNHLGFPIPALEKNLFVIRYFVWVPSPKKYSHGRIRDLLMFVMNIPSATADATSVAGPGATPLTALLGTTSRRRYRKLSLHICPLSWPRTQTFLPWARCCWSPVSQGSEKNGKSRVWRGSWGGKGLGGRMVGD